MSLEKRLATRMICWYHQPFDPCGVFESTYESSMAITTSSQLANSALRSRSTEAETSTATHIVLVSSKNIDSTSGMIVMVVDVMFGVTDFARYHGGGLPYRIERFSFNICEGSGMFLPNSTLPDALAAWEKIAKS